MFVVLGINLPLLCLDLTLVGFHCYLCCLDVTTYDYLSGPQKMAMRRERKARDKAARLRQRQEAHISPNTDRSGAYVQREVPGLPPHGPEAGGSANAGTDSIC